MKKHIGTKVIVILSFLLIGLNLNAIERSQFYSVFSSDSLEDVNNLIMQLEGESENSTTNAFKGALYMQMAPLLSDPKSKLEAFKKGKILLEKEIGDQPNNIEYRFLRFAVQEQSPVFLRYKNEIKEDKNLIITHFSKLDYSIQKQIVNYTKKSKILHKKDLKP